MSDRGARIQAALAARRDRCFLCSWILQDFERHKKLTDWPVPEAVAGSPIFPRLSKYVHLWLEFVSPKIGEGIKVKQMLDAAERALGYRPETKRVVAEVEKLIADAVVENLT